MNLSPVLKIVTHTMAYVYIACTCSCKHVVGVLFLVILTGQQASIEDIYTLLLKSDILMCTLLTAHGKPKYRLTCYYAESLIIGL